MYNFDKLVEKLMQRFKEVPHVEDDDVELWVEQAMIEHDLTESQSVSPELASLILLHAEADGTTQVALRTAHYFNFTDKDETVDKSNVSENYRKAADDLWARYRRKRDEGVDEFGGSKLKFMKRVDRP